MGLITPVAFLVFNRPDTTAQVFAAIRQAEPEMLLLVADGPRDDRPGEADLCAKVRGIIEQIDWPCRVLKNYSEKNLGCKGRVSSGLDWVFSEVEEAIILEDDCLPHSDFFPFCQEMLARYHDDERVMMVGGTNYLVDRLDVPESYVFSRYFPIWGWATWRRAWQNYDITMQRWPRFRKEGQLHGYYADSYMRRFLTSTFDNTYCGRINTWDSQWFFSCLSNNGLSIIPARNMISNIGTVGAHAGGYSANNFFPVFPCDVNALTHPALVNPHQLYDQLFFKEQFKIRPASIVRRLKAFVRRRVRRIRPGSER
ncbi:MAG TPA: glycosyltransferase family 2 protein [Desulfuromonadales bacterium]|nr:glycosyltransferase family 2 protein [Desulfuromonadales bacterium]